MIWIFALGLIVLAVYNEDFRKLVYVGAVLAAIIGLVVVLSMASKGG